MLVAVTNAGSVIGVDLKKQQVLWQSEYKPKPEPVLNQPWVKPGWNPQNVPLNTSAWKVTPPLIHGDKVVFTAPDGNDVQCLKLKDGTPVWKAKRAEDDLYLAGVFAAKVVVVGKRFSKAYTLDKGEESWKLETGLPGGFGIASDDKYYLPVKESAQSKEAEICVIDVPKGQIAAHVKAREKDGKREVPGNLLFADGLLLSQTATETVGLSPIRSSRHGSRTSTPCSRKTPTTPSP